MLTSSGQKHGSQQCLKFRHIVGSDGKFAFETVVKRMTQFRQNLAIYPMGIPQAYYIWIEAIMELDPKRSSPLLLPYVKFRKEGEGLCGVVYRIQAWPSKGQSEI